MDETVLRRLLLLLLLLLSLLLLLFLFQTAGDGGHQTGALAAAVLGQHQLELQNGIETKKRS